MPQRFKLSESFLSNYENVEPPFGPLGEFVFLRTYSRILEDEKRNEHWWETIKRVVEGCFNIQKEHCAKLRLPWVNSKAQKSAQIMYDKIFNFKFLPAGRSLWMQGTKYVEERTPMGLFNCAAVTTEDIDTRGSFPFVWTMDLLMLGCIAKGEKVMTAEGPKNIEDLEGHPFVAIVNGKPHFARFGSWKTGEKDVYKIRTKEGYELKLTNNHKVLTIDNKWKKIKDIMIGEKIQINKSQNIEWDGNGSFHDGYLLGIFWGDGYYSRDPIACIYDKDIGADGIGEQALICLENIIPKRALRKDHAGWRRRESRQIQELSIGTWVTDFINKGKILDDRIEFTSYNFYRGFLRGAFDTDGHIIDTENKTRRVGLTQSNYGNLQVIQRMLLRMGIKSNIYKKREASKIIIQGREVNQKECWDLHITKNSIKRFAWSINFSHKEKRKKLEKILNYDFYKESFVAEVTSLDYAGVSPVYDINVEEVSSFDANGFIVHNCGVGFDVNGAGKITIKQPKNGEGSLEYIIPDSREGWTEALELLLDAFFYGKKLPNFDYSEVRPYGAPIKSFGGTASGPGPLREMLNNIKNLLIERIGEELQSTDIVDIMNFIAVCVVAGNTRRSALLALGSADDKEYVTMKDYNKHPKKVKESRWASNNSVFAEVGKTDYNKFVENIALNGEPGIVWLENLRKYGRLKDGITWSDKEIVTTNPCGEIGLPSASLCNLVETFPSRHETYEEFKETLKYAYLYGKSMTLVSTHWPETNQMIMKNRRIGVSQSGIIDAFVKHGRREILQWSDNGYNYLRELDEIYSNWLCIPKSIKITTTKPSGSVSQLPGVSPGIHYPHSEYYIRRVRLASDSSLIEPMLKAGYNIVNETYGTEETKSKTKVIEFPVHEEFFCRKKDDVTLWEQVKNVVDYQWFWADNAVSNTLTFKKEEAKDISRVLEAYEDQLKSVSFLPISEHGYVLAPYEEIDKETYKKMSKHLKIPDFSHITSIPVGEKYCANDSCELPIREDDIIGDTK